MSAPRSDPVWQPDGAGRRARIGVLTPHLDPVPESEMTALAPEGVSVHAARVPLGMIGPDGEIVPHVGAETARAFSEPPGVDNGVALLTPLQPRAIVYAFTSSSYVLGADADAALAVRLEARSGGVPVVIQTPAVVAALRALAARRIAVIHPPWYAPDLDRQGADYFAARGFEVVHHGAAQLAGEFHDVRPEQLFDWAMRHVPESADVLVIGGSGFRAIGAIGALESSLGRPVISANQAAMWCALRRAGIPDRIAGYGRLFHHGLPAD